MARTTLRRKSSEYGFPIHAGLQPSGKLESQFAILGNLEASVRSRDTIVVRARQRDLIEAGLN
jgi:hypothetical protein